MRVSIRLVPVWLGMCDLLAFTSQNFLLMNAGNSESWLASRCVLPLGYTYYFLRHYVILTMVEPKA